MSGKIIIENRTNVHIQYRIDHQAVCVKAGKCFCKKGARGPVAATVHVPGGVGLKTLPVDSAVAMLSQVKADAAEKKIRIHGAKAKVVQEAEPVGNDSGESTSKKGGGRKSKKKN